jgi:hypothetical protein
LAGVLFFVELGDQVLVLAGGLIIGVVLVLEFFFKAVLIGLSILNVLFSDCDLFFSGVQLNV